MQFISLSLHTLARLTWLSYDDIINILDPFIGEPPDPPRKSNTVNIPNGLTNISTYLKFVDREKEVKQLMINMRELHYLIKNRREYSEPRKETRFPIAVGMPGIGKTTFAQRAYEKSGIYSGIIGPEVMNAVEECQEAGRTFRIACDAISGEMYSANGNESLFGKVLLYEALKYRLNFSLNVFIEMLGSNVMLEDVLEVILHYIPCLDGKIKYPLFIINIDEINALFESEHGNWLREALWSLARAITDLVDRYFLFVVLTGTHADDQCKIFNSSNLRTDDIYLPLLKFKHTEEVLLELANRGVVDEAKRINKLSEHTKYAIKLLGVVGSFLEAMIFQMSIIGSNVSNNEGTYIIDKFYQSGLRYYLEKCQYESKYCDELLVRTKKHINEKYQGYFDHFLSEDNLDLIPHLVAYSLFEWYVRPSDTIGIKKKRIIEDLEKEGLIFFEKDEDYFFKRIKLPLLTLHGIYLNKNNHMLPSIRILDSLDNAISPNQNEKFTISVITFRLWAIYQKSISDDINNITNSCSCKLSELVPLRNGQKDISIKFSPVFTVRSTNKPIDEKNWDDFVNRIKTQPTPECIAYHNMQNAEFADSFLITEPIILIQDKQLIVSRKKGIESYSTTMLEKGLVEKEHNKCKNVGEHIFLFVTNSKKRNDETYEENEVLITEEESNYVFGDLH
ncbi:13149_t:CDS:2 [Acaulospora morrowiae]|uniref:13149_t:CDS:1 n=1 Tax=Acaulospora morrowiae TaxID=94023 RepID=A0A9N9G0V2_9GLOM|nr:13149_t:CDS:2 [Acaulospora morrowiae]